MSNPIEDRYDETIARLEAEIRRLAARVAELEAELRRVAPYLATHGAGGYRMERPP